MVTNGKWSPILIVTLLSALLGACSTSPPAVPDEMDKVYNRVHSQGASDTVELLQEGLREKQVYGVTQPYIPVRRAAEVRTVWVPDNVDPKTGRLVHGHWESTELRSESWFID